MLSPAGTPIPSASDGPFGFGCVGERCFSVRRCRLCTSLSSLRVPGDDDETAISSAYWWNKFFQPRSRPVGVHSGARWRLVKVRSAGFGASASILGSSCTGVMSCSASRLVPVEAMTSQCIGAKGKLEGPWCCGAWSCFVPGGSGSSYFRNVWGVSPADACSRLFRSRSLGRVAVAAPFEAFMRSWCSFSTVSSAAAVDSSGRRCGRP